jgi:peptidoglycan/LPS O-acetylase OafA/YrhL
LVERHWSNVIGRTSIITLAAAGGLFWLSSCRFMSPAMVNGGWLLASVLASILIQQITGTSGTLMHLFLENRVLVYIGKISYGLYIWHFPVLILMKQFNLPWEHMFYMVVVLPLVLASYYLIERPCLRLKYPKMLVQPHKQCIHPAAN